jgi:hypothetical protein
MFCSDEGACVGFKRGEEISPALRLGFRLGSYPALAAFDQVGVRNGGDMVLADQVRLERAQLLASATAWAFPIFVQLDVLAIQLRQFAHHRRCGLRRAAARNKRCPPRSGATGQDDVRRERDQFRRVSARALGIVPRT